jgi:formylglycine-generating enzyme required for sulfatase activity
MKQKVIAKSNGRRKKSQSSKATSPKLRIHGLILVGVAGLGTLAWLFYAHKKPDTAQAGPSLPEHRFEPTLVNPSKAPSPAPKGMVWIPGGEFSMGANDPPDMDEVGMQATTDARPIHRVYVDGFFMDKTDVTNGEFTAFVKATGYVTVAERKPRTEDFPGAPPENLVAGSVVFAPPDHAVQLNDHFQWWSYVLGANWRHPLGTTTNINGKQNYPLVQIAYEGAMAYAKWARKQLPTEAQWEFAARGGLSGEPFVWGDEFRPTGKWMANTYQGHFPNHDTGDDGYVGIAPVAQYPPNGYGLYDMSGNVWQWTSDWYRPDYYQQLAAAGGIARMFELEGEQTRPNLHVVRSAKDVWAILGIREPQFEPLEVE